MIDIFINISKYIENPIDTINLSNICKESFYNKKYLYLYNQYKYKSFRHTKFILNYNPVEIKSINMINNNRYVFRIIKNINDLTNIPNHIYKLIFHETYSDEFVSIPNNITHIVFNCSTKEHNLILPKYLRYLKFNNKHKTDLKLPESLLYLKTYSDLDLHLYYLPNLKYLTTKYHTDISYYPGSLIKLTTLVNNQMPNLHILKNLKKIKLYINSWDDFSEDLDLRYFNLEYLKIINNCESLININIDSKNLRYLELHNIESDIFQINFLDKIQILKLYNCWDIYLSSPISLRHLEVISSDFGAIDISECVNLKYLKIDTQIDKQLDLPKNLKILNIKCTYLECFSLNLPVDNDLDMINISIKPEFTIYEEGLLNIIKNISNIKNNTIIKIDSKVYKYIKNSDIEYLEFQ